MPSAIVTTIGDSTANSYVDLAVADAYFDDRLEATTWSGSTSDNKTRALLMAARRLNNENWQGDRAKTDQALAWPRAGALKPDGVGFGSSDFIPGAGAFLYPRTTGIYWGGYGEQYTSTEIPQPVKDAQCELALAYLEGFNDGGSDALDSFAADGVTMKFRTSKPEGGLPARVLQLISGLIEGNRLVRA